MEPLSPKQVKTLTRRVMLQGMALAAFAPAGCLSKHFVKKESAVPAPTAQGRLVSAWENKVNFAPDTSRGGAAMPVLVGRIFLFGPDMAVPYIGDGSLIIDLYDSSPRQGAPSEPKMIEELRIDPVTLRKLAKKDVFGDGYSVIFPWYTYRPDISQVYIVMRYDSADGKSFYHQSGTFAVDHGETRERIRKGMPISNPAMSVTSATPVVQ